MPYEINTTADTVGEALRQAEVILYLGIGCSRAWAAG